MSALDEALRDALRDFVKKSKAVKSGVASNIDLTEYTCTVTEANGAVTENVQLQALKELTTGAVLIPAEGSWVHMLNIGKPDYLVIGIEVLEKVKVTIGDCVLEMDSSGYKISKGGESLQSCLNDLINTINLLTVPTGTGPSGVPINAGDFTAIQSRLNSFLT